MVRRNDEGCSATRIRPFYEAVTYGFIKISFLRFDFLMSPGAGISCHKYLKKWKKAFLSRKIGRTQMFFSFSWKMRRGR